MKMFGSKKSSRSISDSASRPRMRPWVSDLLDSQRDEACKTIGIISGSQIDNDRASITDIARQVADHASSTDADARTLTVHLDVFGSKETQRLLDQPAGIPPYTRSPLGDWREVTVPVPVGFSASWSLLQLPDWISTWRTQFGTIIIDIGPCNLVPARSIGRLCAGSVILLGPDSTPSHDWLSAQVRRLKDSGVNVVGSVLAARSVAA